MSEPIWMEMVDAVIFHDMELAAHGGSTGLRDAGMLESAIMRPRNLWAYADAPPSLTRLAAAYAFGISSNHPFVDGNKRTAFVVAAGVFLPLNGYKLTASDVESVRTMLSVADGTMSEPELAIWLRTYTRPLKAE